MMTTLKRLVIAGMLLLPGAAMSLHAQVVTSPTPEGTTITNVATATFTDVNNNTYASVKDSAMVKVGFLAAPDPTVPASYTPASPSTGNIANFTLKNSGNGIDSVTVFSVTAASGLTITKYQYNGVDYATLALLNAVIKQVSLVSGASLPFPVKVFFNVDSASGGATLPITLNEASARTPALKNPATTNILPPAAYSVAVTPDSATIANVASNGAPAYTYTFTIKNTGNTSNTFTLSRALSTANSTLVLGALSTTTVTLAAGASATTNLSYTVNNGSGPDRVFVTATGSSGGTDTGDLTVSVSKASITMAKTAWTDTTAAGTLITNTTANAIVPGTIYYYKLSVTNAAGSAAATISSITDVLSGSLTYVSLRPDAAGWTLSQVTGTVTASLSGSIAAGATRYFWIGVKIK